MIGALRSDTDFGIRDAAGPRSYSNISSALPERIVDVGAVALPLVHAALPIETPLTAAPLRGSFSPSALPQIPVYAQGTFAPVDSPTSFHAVTGIGTAAASVSTQKVTSSPVYIGGLIAVVLFAGWFAFHKRKD